MSDADFYRAYEEMAEHGHCDGAGGCEYVRVLREWNELGRPAGVKPFIRARANIASTPQGDTGLN